MVLAGATQLAVAQQRHGQDSDAGTHQGGMMMGMMEQEQMMAMHEHMQEMQILMSRIQSEEDPARREAMMNEHMQMLRGSMSMMGPGMRSGQDQSPQQPDSANGSLDERMQWMQGRMQMFQENMQMMQLMMNQMMEHMAQQ